MLFVALPKLEMRKMAQNLPLYLGEKRCVNLLFMTASFVTQSPLVLLMQNVSSFFSNHTSLTCCTWFIWKANYKVIGSCLRWKKEQSCQWWPTYSLIMWCSILSIHFRPQPRMWPPSQATGRIHWDLQILCRHRRWWFRHEGRELPISFLWNVPPSQSVFMTQRCNVKHNMATL